MGPGHHLKQMLETIGIDSDSVCPNCLLWIKRMDEWGPRGCLVKTNLIRWRLKRSFRGLRLKQKLKAAHNVLDRRLPKTITGLILEAIRRAEDDAANEMVVRTNNHS